MKPCLCAKRELFGAWAGGVFVKFWKSTKAIKLHSEVGKVKQINHYNGSHKKIFPLDENNKSYCEGLFFI